MDRRSQLAMYGLLGAMSSPVAQPVPRNYNRYLAEPGTSVTGVISKDERKKRNLAKRRAKLDRKKNRGK